MNTIDEYIHNISKFVVEREGFAIQNLSSKVNKLTLLDIHNMMDGKKARGIDNVGKDEYDENLDVNLEGYYHTDTTNFTGRENWIRGGIDQKPLLAIGLETWPAENFYGYSELSVGNTYTLEKGFGTTQFASNVIMLPPALMPDLDFNIPYRAFVAAGGNRWTFQLGRDRLNWGAGTSGNLMLSDTLKYHNMARITTYGSIFLLAGSGMSFDSGQWTLIAAGCTAAFARVMVGKRYLHKVTMRTIQTITGCLLLGIAIALLAGIL